MPLILRYTFVSSIHHTMFIGSFLTLKWTKFAQQHHGLKTGYVDVHRKTQVESMDCATSVNTFCSVRRGRPLHPP